MAVYERDAKGWRVKTRLFTFHPVSYGVGTLARLSIGLHPEGRRLMLHYFPKNEALPEHWHDHPWPFTTVVLWGEYLDQAVYPPSPGHTHPTVVNDCLQMGSIRRRSASHRHRTVATRRTVTLVFRGPTVRTWCEGSTVDWKCDGDPADFDATLGRRPL